MVKSYALCCFMYIELCTNSKVRHQLDDKRLYYLTYNLIKKYIDVLHFIGFCIFYLKRKCKRNITRIIKNNIKQIVFISFDNIKFYKNI